jgi:condensin complex subunit 3
MSDVESEQGSEAVVIKVPKAKKGKKKVVKNDENERTSNLPPVAEAIMHVLGDCQRSVAGHKRGLTSVLAAMGKVDTMGAFMQYFTPALDRILVVFKREPGVERLVKFVGLMATHSVKKHAEQRDQFLDSLLRYLMVRSTTRDKAVRFRCCQLVATVLHALDPEAEIAEDLFDEVEASMLLRSRDKIPVVRVQAIMALSRLQTEEADCPVTEEFERILRTDSSKDARKAVLNELAVSPRSRDLVLERMHDVSPEVRKEAYGVVKSKFLLQSLTIKQRNFIVRTGLKERDDGVKKACSAVLLTSWLPAANDNIITLMRTLDVLQYTQEVELLAAHLLKESGSKNKTPSPPYTQDELTPESALYWQLSCQLGVSKEDFLPDTVALCQLIESVSAAEPVEGGPDESVAEDEESRFVLEQLLRLCLLVDLQDEAGRKQLESLCSALLCNKSLPETMIAHVTRAMRSYFGRDEHGYLRAVLETLSDIRDPLEATGTDNEVILLTPLAKLFMLTLLTLLTLLILPASTLSTLSSLFAY